MTPTVAAAFSVSSSSPLRHKARHCRSPNVWPGSTSIVTVRSQPSRRRGGCCSPPNSAKRRFGPAEDLAAIGAQSLAATALLAGAAAGPVATGEAKFVRLGTGSDTVLLGYLDNAHPANKAEREGACATMADEGEDGIALALSPPLTDTAAPGRDQGSSEPSPEDTASACGDAADAAEGSAAMAVAEDEPRPRPLPARFTWQMDAGGRFTLGSDEFTEIIGTRIAIALGRPWQEINAELGLDPEDCFRRAADTREMFSNVTVSWPVENYPERLDVALAGLPVFGRDRNFLGYRGFGLCRDADRIENLRTMRRLALFGTPPTIAGAKPTAGRAAAATILGPFGEAIARQEMPPPLPQENVVRFPEAASANARPGAAGSPSLSAGEHHAFHEIARHLTARLENRAIPPAETLHNPSPAALTTTFPARDPAGAGLRTDSALPVTARPWRGSGTPAWRTPDLAAHSRHRPRTTHCSTGCTAPSWSVGLTNCCSPIRPSWH